MTPRLAPPESLPFAEVHSHATRGRKVGSESPMKALWLPPSFVDVGSVTAGITDSVPRFLEYRRIVPSRRASPRPLTLRPPLSFMPVAESSPSPSIDRI